MELPKQVQRKIYSEDPVVICLSTTLPDRNYLEKIHFLLFLFNFGAL
jgi:hypothetical protein